MRTLLISFVLSMSFGMAYAQEYRSEKKSGEYDEKLECIVGEDGYCQSKYVDDLFSLTEDCDIPPPEFREPSAPEIFIREWGIYLLYKYYDYKYWVWTGAASLCFLYYKHRNS